MGEFSSEHTTKKQQFNPVTVNHLPEQRPFNLQRQPNPNLSSREELQAKKEWHQQYGLDLTSMGVQIQLSEEEELQAKPLPETISPKLQKQEMPIEEEEPVQAHFDSPASTTLNSSEANMAQLQAKKEWHQQYGLDLTSMGIQTKLTIGQPGDKYEQEADNMASQVMSMADPTAQNVQRQETEEETLQPKPFTDGITPVGQRQTSETPQQDSASQSLESQLATEKGGGSPLSDEVRGFMEPRFGADFSEVRVHTGSAAVQMNQQLGAQAFTHGNDIYYGKGKAPGNDALTAHELTHVVQQTELQLSEKPLLQNRFASFVIQKQDGNSTKIQYFKLSQHNVDRILGMGFYEEWRALINDVGDVAGDAERLSILIPDNQGERLHGLAVELFMVMVKSHQALLDAVTLGEREVNEEEQRTAIKFALDQYNYLNEFMKKVRVEVSTWHLLIRAKIFEMLAAEGKAKIKRIEELNKSFIRLEKLLKYYQNILQEALSDIGESWVQLGTNIAVGIAALSVSGPIALFVGAASAIGSPSLDRLLGPPGSYTESDINSMVGSEAGITEALAEMKKYKTLEKGARAVGKASVLIGAALDSKEVSRAYARSEAISIKLKELSKVYNARVEEYKTLLPIVKSYSLSIQIINGLSREAAKAREQATSINQ